MNTCVSDNNHTGINDEIRKKFNISECLDLFTRKEKLDKDNEWYCSKCKGHKQATKKMELYKIPNTFVIHLKRFKTSRIGTIGSMYFPAGSTKINSFVDFGLEIKLIGKTYNLIGVTNHYGQMNGGHYTAFCKNHLDGKWYEFDDTNVTECKSHNELFSEDAYMLFYQLKNLNKL